MSERAEAAAKMYALGSRYSDIARELKVSPVRARQMVRKGRYIRLLKTLVGMPTLSTATLVRLDRVGLRRELLIDLPESELKKMNCLGPKGLAEVREALTNAVS